MFAFFPWSNTQSQKDQKRSHVSVRIPAIDLLECLVEIGPVRTGHGLLATSARDQSAPHGHVASATWTYALACARVHRKAEMSGIADLARPPYAPSNQYYAFVLPFCHSLEQGPRGVVIAFHFRTTLRQLSVAHS